MYVTGRRQESQHGEVRDCQISLPTGHRQFGVFLCGRVCFTLLCLVSFGLVLGLYHSWAKDSFYALLGHSWELGICAIKCNVYCDIMDNISGICQAGSRGGVIGQVLGHLSSNDQGDDNGDCGGLFPGTCGNH